MSQNEQDRPSELPQNQSDSTQTDVPLTADQLAGMASTHSRASSNSEGIVGVATQTSGGVAQSASAVAVPTDDALASLEKKLQEAHDARCEERFIWIVVCTILIDYIMLRNTPSFMLGVIILALEFLIFLILAKRMGVEEIPLFVNNLLKLVIGAKNGG